MKALLIVSYVIYSTILLSCVFYMTRLALSRKGRGKRSNNVRTVLIMSSAALAIASAYCIVARAVLNGDYVILASLALSPVFLVRIVHGKAARAPAALSLVLVTAWSFLSFFRPVAFSVGVWAFPLMAVVSVCSFGRTLWKMTGASRGYSAVLAVLECLKCLVDIFYLMILVLVIYVGAAIGCGVSWWKASISFICLLLVASLVGALFRRRRDKRMFLVLKKRERRFADALSTGLTYSVRDGVRNHDNAERLFLRLREYFERDKPYLDPNLTLDKAAKRLLTNKQYLSNAVNTYTGKNFCRFVNYYRVRYAVELFRADNSCKIVELAMKSGFRTQHSFTMAFSLNMNISPSKWCRMNKGIVADN